VITRNTARTMICYGSWCDPEKAMAPHSSTLAWKIPWTEEPGRLQSMGSLRVRHDWATSLSLFMHWRRKWQPTPVFSPGESQGQGEPGGLPSMGLHSVGHDWSDLAAAAAAWCDHFNCTNHSVFSQEPDPKAADKILKTIKDNHRALQSSYNLENSNFLQCWTLAIC